MSSCIFCEEQDDVRDMKIYNACELLDGKPCGPCIEYLELEAQIEETRRTLEEQILRRRKKRKNINRVHDTMLIRVPLEITAYIFELAVSVDVPPDGTVSKSLLAGELYAPLPLGKVCGAWRHIAWGMPQLWKFMFAQIRSVEDLPVRLDIATQWLSRSGQFSPLSIHFRIEYDEDWKKFRPFIGLLNLYSHRWRDLCGVAQSYLLERLSAKCHGAPILQNLQLSLTDVSDDMTFNLGCERLPQPRSVHFNHVYEPNFQIDWGRVTQLETNTLLIDLFLDRLPHLPELKELRVYGVGVDVDHQARSVTHLKLESLDIRCTKPNHRERAQILCNSLTLPSLRHLKIGLFRHGTMADTVVSLIQRSACNLSSLSLAGCPSNSPISLIRLLEAANSIEELEISTITKYDGDMLMALGDHIKDRDNPLSRPVPLSNLQRLTYILGPTVPREVPWKFLLRIFDPKWVANQPRWKTLSISRLPMSSRESKWHMHTDLVRKVQKDLVHKNLQDDVLERLLNLVEAGIELFLPTKMTKNHILDLMKAKADDRAERMAKLKGAQVFWPGMEE